MSQKPLLRQLYWINDTERQNADKVDRAIRALQHISDDRERDWELVIQRHTKKRTPEANAYLWAVVYVLMSEASGYTKEEVHEAMCYGFFGAKVVEIGGVRFKRPLRTTTTNEEGEPEWLGSEEFAQFVDYAIQEAAIHFDVAVPPPVLRGPE